jgi:hypothetical protein
LLATVAAPNLVTNAESFASKPLHTLALFRNVQLQQQSLNKPLSPVLLTPNPASHLSFARAISLGTKLPKAG